MVGRHEADVGEVAIALRVVHAVADDEEIGDREADVVRVDLFDAARRLVEKGGDARVGRPARQPNRSPALQGRNPGHPIVSLSPVSPAVRDEGPWAPGSEKC